MPNIPNDIALNLQILRLRLEGKTVCENCGCEMEEEDIVEGEDGELLCEECADEMYESIEEGAEGEEQDESLDECACQDESTDSDDEEGLTEKSKKATSKFRSLVSKLAMHNATNPVGLAAWIGAKKMGKGNVAKGRKMLQKMAVKARKKG